MVKNNKTSKEHLLELILILRERGIDNMDVLLNKTKEPEAEKLIGELIEEGYVKLDGERVFLTPEGNKYSESVVRRLRLAEVLLSEILEVDEEIGMNQACEFEHILTPEVTESICTFLGHPLHCPHGLKIPRGNCCATFNKIIGPLVKPLIDLKIGDSGKIVFINPKSHSKLDRLMTFGITPGSIIKLHQRKPSIVLQIGETDLAIDMDIAEGIYVKNVNGAI